MIFTNRRWVTPDSLICFAAASATKHSKFIVGYSNATVRITFRCQSSYTETANVDLFTASENAELIYKTANLATKVGNYAGISMDCFEI